MESKAVRMTPAQAKALQAALRDRWSDYWSGGRSALTALERLRFERRYHDDWERAERALELTFVD